MTPSTAKGLALILIIIAALAVVCAQVIRYGRALERRTPGLPMDGKGCLTPREQAALDDIEARYRGSPAREERT